MSRQTGNGQHRALGRLHHSAVGSGNALLHGGGQCRAVSFGETLEGLGHAAEQQGQNDAGVAAGAPQEPPGRYLGGVVNGGRLGFFQLGAGGLNGQIHVGAGIAVGDGKDIQVVDGLFLPRNAGSAEEHHLLKGGTADFLYHLAVILP